MAFSGRFNPREFYHACPPASPQDESVCRADETAVLQILVPRTSCSGLSSIWLAIRLPFVLAATQGTAAVQHRGRCYSLVGIAFLLLLCAHGALAANHIVTNTNDSGAGSLRQALADANDGDTIDATGISGVITLTSGQLLVGVSMTINGPTADALAIDGNSAGRVFQILSGKTATISDFTIRNGHAGTIGGGIFNGDAATLTIANTTLTGNTAGLGAAIFNNGTLTIVKATLSGNTAAQGGGIYNSGAGTLTMVNSTLSGNAATSAGGGIFNIGTLEIANSTVTGNTAGDGGGIFNTVAIAIGNSILNAGTTGGTIVNSGGTVTSNGYNLSSDNGGGFLTAIGDQINTDPMLGPLKHNGGPTLTHAPLTGSPAIDRGNDIGATGHDQRGNVRPVRFDNSIVEPPGGDGSDIGAVELAVGVEPTSAASRKTHGSAGVFDVNLPLSGNVGIECRSGGANNDYQIIVNFVHPVTFSSAAVTSGIGTVSSSSGSGTTQVTVNLTSVANAQRLTVGVFDINDGTHSGDVGVRIGVLVGDTTGNGVVNAADIAQVKSQVGQAVNASNFRTDVTPNGLINASDAALVKSKSGTSLP
jgi:Dockerin type I domain